MTEMLNMIIKDKDMVFLDTDLSVNMQIKWEDGVLMFGLEPFIIDESALRSEYILLEMREDGYNQAYHKSYQSITRKATRYGLE